MECCRSCEVEFDYAWPFSRNEIRKARKQHVCCECRATIEPGQRYEYAVGKYEDGGMWTAKTCMTCRRIRRDFCKSWTYGGLREALWECLGIDYITGEIAEWAKKEDDDGEA